MIRGAGSPQICTEDQVRVNSAATDNLLNSNVQVRTKSLFDSNLCADNYAKCEAIYA